MPLAEQEDPPDFLVESPNGKIGIEVTSLFKSTIMKGQEVERELTVTNAEQIYITKGYPSVDVSVYFRESSILTKRGRAILAEEIASLVAKNLPPFNSYISFMDILPLASLLPESIIDIRVARFSSVDVNCWSVSGFGWTQTEFVNELQEALERKSKKILKAKTICNQYWLLCVAEDMGDSSFLDPSEETSSHQYCSHFHRVFFLRMSSRKWIELNNSQPSNLPISK